MLNEWSTLRKLMFYSATASKLTNETVSGNPAVFETDVAKPLKSMLIPFTPVQEGSGDPSPSNVRPISGWTGVTISRFGKNLLDPNNLVNKNYGGNASSLNVRADNLIPVKPGAKMVWKSLSSVSEKDVRFYDADGRLQSDYSLAVYSGETVVFTVPEDSYFIRPKWYRNGSDLPVSEVVASNPTIEYGEEPTAYEPYVEPEVRHIEFPAQGKNLFKLTSQSGSSAGLEWVCNDGVITVSGTPTGYAHIDCGTAELPSSGKVVCSGGYVLGTNITWGNCIVNNADGERIAIFGGSDVPYFSFDVADYPGAKTITLGIKRKSNNVECSGEIKLQVETGTTPTTFEPYDNTVYGGELDLTTGVLTVTHIMLRKNTADMNNTENYPGWQNADVAQYIGSGIDKKFNIPTNVTKFYEINTKQTSGTIYFAQSSFGLTQTEWIALALDVQIIIELTTPQTIQLDPVAIQALNGGNTIWTNTNGTNVIIYKKKG